MQCKTRNGTQTSDKEKTWLNLCFITAVTLWGRKDWIKVSLDYNSLHL